MTTTEEEEEPICAALECLETVLLCAPVELLPVAQQTALAGAVRALLFAEPGALAVRARETAERCAALCALSASWTLSQALAPLVECGRASAFASACCDALLCPRRAPLAVRATPADAAYRRAVLAERAATAARDVVAEQRARHEDEEEEEEEVKTPSGTASAPVDMSGIVVNLDGEKEGEEEEKEKKDEESVVVHKEETAPMVVEHTKSTDSNNDEYNDDDDGDLMIDADAEPDAEDADSGNDD